MINASEYRAMELRNTIALPACAGHLNSREQHFRHFPLSAPSRRSLAQWKG